jgi:hypothetical protein
MQNYSKPAARNEKAAAGVKPGMVSVKFLITAPHHKNLVPLNPNHHLALPVG